MAVDPDGLKRLNELHSLPKACTQEAMAASGDQLRFQACVPSHKPVRGGISEKGLIVIPGGTESEFEGRRFVLPGGRLVIPYPANTYDMARDGAIEVEKVKITHGPNQGREGWIETGFLGRVCCGL